MIIKPGGEKPKITAFTKLVADVSKKVVSLGCDLHIDCAEELLANGSESKDLWGANIYPDGRIDFVSLINIRPQDNNRSMEIGIPEIKEQVNEIIKELIV